MAKLPGKVHTFRPKGVCDCQDGTNAYPGAMQLLKNLIPSQQTASVFIPRPASVQATDFTGWQGTTPAQVTALVTVGAQVYGMVSATGGKDYPFCYDLAAAAFVNITNYNDANDPTTQATTGDWTPPTMTVVNNTIIVTHPGFAGAAGHFFGTIDISTPAVPVWAVTNTTTNALTSVPTCCGSMNGRAWFGLKNQVWYSDSLAPTTITNATQKLTIGDAQAVTAIAPNSFTSVTVGGVIQSLIVFKSDEAPYQITGDTATSNLAVNSLNAPAGTLAPNTICPTPLGLLFVSTDGLRVIDAAGVIHSPIGTQGEGINNPFINVVSPSRMVAAFNSNVYRVSLTYKAFDGGNVSQTATVEFWYHIGSDVWTGPHSFPADMIAPVQANTGHGFIAMGHGINAKLWSSDTLVTTNSTYTENGTALTWEYQTVLLPDNEEMMLNRTVQTKVAIAVAAAGTYTFVARDEQNVPLNTVTAVPAGWGTGTWNQSFWASTALVQQPIFWTQPIVYQQMSLDITGPSGASVAIGNCYIQMEPLPYHTPQFLVPVTQ